MPEKEFELYLSLLSRFLRLKPSQHDEIADELRDHLEERLEDLAARGLSREEAIRSALDEFGDAAALARHFTHATHIRRRRLIMRCTVGTVAALAASFLVATAFWPADPQNPIARKAQAQSPAAAPAALNREKPHLMSFGTAEEKLRETLASPTEVNFSETTLEDALNYVKEYHHINIWIDKSTLADEGISLETPVTLYLQGVSFRSVLKLLLEPQQLTYLIEDEVMKITTSSKAVNVIGVYDIRDLVGVPRIGGPAKSAPEAAAAASAAESAMLSAIAAGGGAKGPAKPSRPIAYETSSFSELVAHTIAPSTWVEAGGDGWITQYNGMLVVRNGQTVQDDVKDFIKLMRLARGEPQTK